MSAESQLSKTVKSFLLKILANALRKNWFKRLLLALPSIKYSLNTVFIYKALIEQRNMEWHCPIHREKGVGERKEGRKKIQLFTDWILNYGFLSIE